MSIQQYNSRVQHCRARWAHARFCDAFLVVSDVVGCVLVSSDCEDGGEIARRVC